MIVSIIINLAIALIALQIAPIDQGLAQLLAIICIPIFGSYVFTWQEHKEFIKFKDEDFLKFREEHHAWQLRMLEEWVPHRDGRREARRVALVNALEPYVDLSNPFTDREKSLNRLVYGHGIETLGDQETVKEFIRAWDRHKSDPNPQIQQAAREILREANDYLQELVSKQEGRAATESQTFRIPR